MLILPRNYWLSPQRDCNIRHEDDKYRIRQAPLGSFLRFAGQVRMSVFVVDFCPFSQLTHLQPLILQ